MLLKILMLILTALVSSDMQDLMCYNCNSYFNKSCEEPQPNMNIFVTNCNGTNFPKKFQEGASQFFHMLKTPFITEARSAGKEGPKRPICLSLILKDSKGIKVYIRSCGIDTFGAKDICDSIEAVETQEEISKSFCKHCDEKLCNDHSRAISLFARKFAVTCILSSLICSMLI